MTPVEVMTSESQERMLAIVEPEHLDAVLEICARWEVRASVVGRVTAGGRFRVVDGAFDDDAREVLADVPAASLGDGPVYTRPAARPASQEELQAADPWPTLARRFPDGADLGPELLGLLGAPTLADKSWIWRQYDHQLFLNTVVGPGADTTVLRLRGTRRALALSTDGSATFCRLDPRVGGRLAVLEAARNVACVGALPRAVVNCLNFGNPEHPAVMWQFAEVVDGIQDACGALGVPVIGGNVSFYNESHGHDIDPTPVIGLVGLLEFARRRPPARRARPRAGGGAPRRDPGGAGGLGLGEPPRPDRRATTGRRPRPRRRGARLRPRSSPTGPCRASTTARTGAWPWRSPRWRSPAAAARP